jgi:SAM-dependent methyltransferase
MLDSAEEAGGFPTGMVRLALCQGCGFVTNTAFDPVWSAYAPNYEDQQSFSSTFNSFAGRLAIDLVERYGLRGGRVVEVGCSKGDFLRLLLEAGMEEAAGIDPSAVEGRVPPPSPGRMRLIPEYYGRAHLDLACDLLCCRHTLEHILPVHETLRLMRDHADRAGARVVCIEVPDAARLWRDCAFEDIYFEHCSYFTPGSLAAAVRRAGFAVFDLRREYDGQYLVIEAGLDSTADRQFAIEETPAETAADVARFRAKIGAAVAGWRETLRREAGAGRRVAIWGSGSKCVAFLRTLGEQDAIAAIVDINPHRTGKFAPGLGMPIGAPELLRQVRPDLIVVMNDIYLPEIRRACGELGLDAEIAGLSAGTAAILAGHEVREVQP